MDDSFSEWAERQLARIEEDRAALGLVGFYSKYWALAFLAARNPHRTEEERSAALEALRILLGENRIHIIPSERWRSEIRPALEREHANRESVERAALFENLEAAETFTPFEAPDALRAIAKGAGNQIRAEWSDRAGRYRDLAADLDDQRGADSADWDLEADARAEWASLRRAARLTEGERQALAAFAAHDGDAAAAAASIRLRIPTFRKRLERISKKIVRP